MPFDFSDILQAEKQIRRYVPVTPLDQSYFLGDVQHKVFFKLESFQRAKSFKIRGALNKMMSLSEEDKKRGVATVSSGNHGSSVSYAASLLDIENAVIIVPKPTPESKIDKIKYFGGKVLLMGDSYDQSHAQGMQYINEHGLTYIDPYYDDPKIYAGQGTIGIEILKQNPDIDTIIVPVGGGGLITGIAVATKAIKSSVKIIGVQTEACPAMIKAVEDNCFYSDFPAKPTICDALVGGIGALSYSMVREVVDELVMVKEESVAKAVSFMAKEEKYVVEPGSCTVVAAVMDYGKRLCGKNTALVISGGNIDGELLTKLLEKY